MKRLAAAALLPVLAGCVDHRAEVTFAASRPGDTAVAYFTGDAGLRGGMGVPVAKALAARGFTVKAFGSPHWFADRRTRGEVEAYVATAARRTLAETGAQRLVLIGQSFGADILHVGLDALPEALRGRVRAVVLVVPGRTVYFQVHEYDGPPDAVGHHSAGRIDWTPLTCIRGREETDSLCPDLAGRARLVVLPGGHPLRRDSAALTREILTAIP